MPVKPRNNPDAVRRTPSLQDSRKSTLFSSRYPSQGHGNRVYPFHRVYQRPISSSSSRETLPTCFRERGNTGKWTGLRVGFYRAGKKRNRGMILGRRLGARFRSSAPCICACIRFSESLNRLGSSKMSIRIGFRSNVREIVSLVIFY